MRRFLTTLVTSGLVLALATPATAFAAADDASPTKPAAAPATVVATETAAAPAVPAPSLRASIDRAVIAVLSSAPAGGQAPAPVTRRSKTTIRAQGGGKTGMIIGLVSTLVGLGATVYMVRMMQKNAEENKD
jgi:hypothetical protein